MDLGKLVKVVLASSIISGCITAVANAEDKENQKHIWNNGAVVDSNHYSVNSHTHKNEKKIWFNGAVFDADDPRIHRIFPLPEEPNQKPVQKTTHSHDFKSPYQKALHYYSEKEIRMADEAVDEVLKEATDKKEKISPAKAKKLVEIRLANINQNVKKNKGWSYNEANALFRLVSNKYIEVKNWKVFADLGIYYAMCNECNGDNPEKYIEQAITLNPNAKQYFNNNMNQRQKDIYQTVLSRK